MKRFALIGEKLGHSYSKLIHERYFELSSKMDYTYELIEIPKENLKEEFVRISGEYDGINVTIPYKLDVMEFLSWISAEAQKIGAVNTVMFTEQGAKGYNTDYFGFKNTLEVNGIAIDGKDVVIMGTGGASKAVVAVCEDLNAKSITFVSIEPEPVPGYKTITYDDEIKGDVLINCTPVGMHPHTDASPIAKPDPRFEAVIDVIYNPSATKLMQLSSANGAKTVNGLYMLVSQAMHSESIWNGEDVAKGVTDAIYMELKAQFDQPICTM